MNTRNSGLADQQFSVDNLPSSELQYLQEFYDSTNGPNWRVNRTDGIPWDFSVDGNPCVDNWQGVNCTLIGDIYHVSRLVLPAYNLEGSIPDDIDKLPQLSDLNQRNNSLARSIPSTIGNLHKLTYLDISANELVGTMPVAVGHLTTLQVLDVGSNQLDGTAPNTFGQLQSLLYLRMDDNDLWITSHSRLAI